LADKKTHKDGKEYGTSILHIDSIQGKVRNFWEHQNSYGNSFGWGVLLTNNNPTISVQVTVTGSNLTTT
jgi:hypothetical protein